MNDVASVLISAAQHFSLQATPGLSPVLSKRPPRQTYRRWKGKFPFHFISTFSDSKRFHFPRKRFGNVFGNRRFPLFSTFGRKNDLIFKKKIHNFQKIPLFADFLGWKWHFHFQKFPLEKSKWK